MDPCINGEVYYVEGDEIHRGLPGGKPRVFAKGVKALSLVANASGSLLACLTPKAILIYDVGDATLISTIETEPKTAKWHPLSTDDSATLLVLARGKILAYDLSDVAHPEVVIPPNSSVATAADTSIELDYGLYDPVDFCFGPSHTATGSMSLYITSSDGDIFGLCPVLPPRFAMSETALSRLLDYSVEYKDRPFALAYIGELAKHASSGSSGHILIDRPTRISAPAVQGPFRLAPFPESMYTEDSFSLMSCSIGPSLAPMTLLAHSTSKHAIFYLSDEPLKLQWDSSDPPSFAVVAAVPLSPNDVQHTVVQLTTEFAFVKSQASVSVVDIRPWTKQIIDALGSGSKLPELSPSVVSQIPPCRIWAPNFTSSGGETKSWGDDAGDVALSLSELNLENARPSGHPFLDQDEVAKLTAQVDRTLRSSDLLSASSGAPIEADLGSLVQLTKLSDVFDAQLAEVYTATSALSLHRTTQQRELRLQLQRLSEIQAFINKPSQSNLTPALERQKRIRDRVNAIGASVLAQKERGTPPGTDERLWYSELKRVQKKAEGLSDRASSIAHSVSKITPAAPSTTTKADPQLLRELNQVVNAQGEQLAELENSVRSALDTHRVSV